MRLHSNDERRVYWSPVSYQVTTHTTLLLRLSDGADSQAWHEFCDRYGELIHTVSRRYSLQSADCDEVLQDVLVALSRAMPGFQYDPAKGKFRSYLKTVVLHAIFRRKAQSQGEVPLDDVGALTGALVIDQHSEETWEAEWRQYHLRMAMRTIHAEFSRADVTAFKAYALEGMEARASAELLGLSIDQIYQAKSRILKRLSQIVEKQIKDEG